MSSIRIRPRFKDELPYSLEDFKSLIQKGIDDSDELTGLVSDNYCVLQIRPEERHYWSPRLTLSLDEPTEGNPLLVRGLYGPKPSVWAVFFMSYAALAVLALFVGVIGLSRMMLDQSASILWALPVMGAVALVLYLVAQAGQKVGAEQMFRIHHFYEALVKHRIGLK